MLDKLRIGPTNKMTSEVEHFFGITDAMDGLQIRRDAPGKRSGVMEFLFSGGNNEGELITKTTGRPAGSKQLFPREERQIEVLGRSLADVLTNAEGPIAAALREDKEWYRRT